MRVFPFTILLLLLLLGTITSANGVQILKLNKRFNLFAEVYTENILRLTVRQTEWVYVPEHVIVPKANKTIDYKCHKQSCEITVGNCHAKTDVARETVDVVYTCDGAPTITASIPLSATGESVSAVTSFPAAQTMYGLAEHAADLALRPGSEYELYNTDAFQYPINNTGALYGSVPFVMAYGKGKSAGLLFLNGSPMKVKVLADAVPKCEWNAQAGLVDLFLFSGPTPSKVHRMHGYLTGHTFMPPYASLGFHQCRWNYMSTQDALSIDEGFDTHSMPYDVLWLDIEHTDGRKYFTWDSHSFPDPKILVQALNASGRKLTTVKDPHVKREAGYSVHDVAAQNNFYVKTAQGDDFTGHCWPGTSSWPDFLNSRTRNWYASLFSNEKYALSSDIYTWVDMNEPSVFQGEKASMRLDAVHLTDDGKKVNHRTIHNMYSLLSIMPVYEGALHSAGAAVQAKRPFILSRSFFPGVQRYAAVWNGDNMARWNHLESTMPELLSLSLSNIPFVGADIGGFFFNTDEDLFVRWMQSAIFYPFMRSHTHLETKRHEPWTYSKEAQNLIRNSLALRYALIPYLYTTFYTAHRDGEAILRPLIYDFPEQEELREEQQAAMFGPALLVRPVVARDAREVSIPFPQHTIWYSYQSGEEVVGGGTHSIATDLSTIPLFIRGGYIVPMKLRLRRSTFAARFDPFTLYVALNEQRNSYGELYLDDGETFAFEKGSFILSKFSYSQNALSCSFSKGGAASDFDVANLVERVVVYGFVGKLTAVTATSTTATGETLAVPLEFERVGSSIIVRKPNLRVAAEWKILFQ